MLTAVCPGGGENVTTRTKVLKRPMSTMMMNVQDMLR